MKRIDLYELNKKLDSEKIEDMEPIALYTFVSDSFYFSGINIRLLSQSKYNKKIAERYCANTLMKKLYEDRYIEEWCYFTYTSIRRTLREFGKDKGFKDGEDLRIKLISMHHLILEFDEYMKKLAYEIED